MQTFNGFFGTDLMEKRPPLDSLVTKGFVVCGLIATIPRYHELVYAEGRYQYMVMQQTRLYEMTEKGSKLMSMIP